MTTEIEDSATDADSTGEPPHDRDLDTNYMVVLVAKGGARLQPSEGIQLNGFQTDAGPASVGLRTRFQEVGLPNRLPQELIFEVRCPADDLDDAVARGSTLATSLAPLIAFTVNGFVDVPRAHLAYEASPGRCRRRFWQEDVQLGVDTFTPSRVLSSDLLIPLLEAVFTSEEQSRLGRAISHYHAALRDWTTAGQPLALMHLYPALEALGPALSAENGHASAWPTRRLMPCTEAST